MVSRALRTCIFSLNERLFAVNAEHLFQVVNPKKLSVLPNPSGDLLGLFAVQGQVMPLLNIGEALGLKTKAHKQFLLVRAEGLEAGFGVDSILDFLPLTLKEDTSTHPYALGTLDYAAKEVVILDIPKWLRATKARLAA